MHYSHGEVNLMEINKLPSNAKRITISTAKFKIADSEVTGNYHHVTVDKDNTEMYEHEGKLFMKNSVSEQVSCVDTQRHDTIEIEPSTWEIFPSTEYNHQSKEDQIVAD